MVVSSRERQGAFNEVARVEQSFYLPV